MVSVSGSGAADAAMVSIRKAEKTDINTFMIPPFNITSCFFTAFEVLCKMLGQGLFSFHPSTGISHLKQP